MVGAAAFGACATATARVPARTGTDLQLVDTTIDEKDLAQPPFQLTEYGVPRIPNDIELSKPWRILVSFVIDTTGRAVETTFKVIRSDHASLTRAVRAALPAMRFIPARLKTGRAVRMIVQLPFVYN